VRRAADVRAGDTVTLKVVGPGQVMLEVIPRMTLAESFERYRIPGNVNLDALQAAAEHDLAIEALSELDE